MFRKQKIRVYYLSENELEISTKIKRLSDLVYFDKKKKRIIIRTTKPLWDKGTQCYFVYLSDVHTFNPNTSKIIDTDVLKYAKQLAKEQNIAQFYTTKQIKIEDLSPHQLTENVISRLLDQQFTENLILASLQVSKQKVLLFVVIFLLGLFMGLGWAKYIMP